MGDQHPTVAIRLNNLAILLRDTNRIKEAEPLLRRALKILDSFRAQTGHEHPGYQSLSVNFQALQKMMGSKNSD